MPHELAAEQWPDYGYVKVGSVDQPAGADVEQNTFDLSDEPLQAQWVFLMLYESNVPGAFDGPNGEKIYSYEVAELEIYGFEQPDDACD
jgi:hypothetical protein